LYSAIFALLSFLTYFSLLFLIVFMPSDDQIGLNFIINIWPLIFLYWLIYFLLIVKPQFNGSITLIDKLMAKCQLHNYALVFLLLPIFLLYLISLPVIYLARHSPFYPVPPHNAVLQKKEKLSLDFETQNDTEL